MVWGFVMSGGALVHTHCPNKAPHPGHWFNIRGTGVNPHERDWCKGVAEEGKRMLGTVYKDSHRVLKAKIQHKLEDMSWDDLAALCEQLGIPVNYETRTIEVGDMEPQRMRLT